jgi:hypothetical protein
VTLGLCSQLELDLAVEKASGRRSKGAPGPDPKGATLRPASEAVSPSSRKKTRRS